MNPVGYAPIPQPLISQIAASGIVVDPPLVVMAAVTNADEQRILASEFSQEFKLGSLENVRPLHAPGVTITAGTDSPLGNLRFGESLHRELELLVEAGLSPKEAIPAATSWPASLLKRGSEIGTIQIGKRGDLIAVAGNPFESISNIRNVRLIMRDGQVLNFGPAR